MTTNAIVNWSRKQNKWKQDALRRIALSSELTDDDHLAILHNLFRENGIPVEAATDCEPLTIDMLTPDSSTARLARLCSVDDVRNANRLASGQCLQFALQGITLIYGHNASGKSGYCRIMKKLCRALVKDPIYPDVFSDEVSKPAQARIRYQFDRETQVHETTWVDGEPGSQDIAHLSVFDSSNARLYVDEKNRIDYLPYEIELLTRLGRALESLQADVENQIDNLNQRLSVNLSAGYTPDSQVHRLLEQLSTIKQFDDLPTLQEIETLGSWTDKHAQKLHALEKLIGDDPIILAQRCKRIQQVLETLREEFDKALKPLSDASVKSIEQAVNNARVADKTASITAANLFQDEPLSAVGSRPWQRMFKYATEYITLAHAGTEIHSLLESRWCPLCQQQLDTDAQARLLRFENYISGRAKKEADAAADTCKNLISTVESVSIRPPEDVQALLAEFGAMNDDRRKVQSKIVTFSTAARNRQKYLLRAVKSGDFSNMPELNASTVESLLPEIQQLSKEAIAHEKASTNKKQREQLKASLAELEDRRRFSQELAPVYKRHSDLELRAKLQDCRKSLNTMGVSKMVSSIRKKMVTEDLDKRIRSEIENFGLTHIPLTINDVSRKGESLVAVSLDSKQKVQSKDVLSEGEQRALGLACFLADVNGQPVKHGIIVDDPVSSLDHVRIRRVANRLVREASSGRQVIVFSHNLLFLSEVMTNAAANSPDQVPVLVNTIRKSEELGFGLIDGNDEPWESKPVNKRIILLRGKTKSIENMNKDDEEAYRRSVKDFYTHLRETWERLVEEVLLRKVVARFGSDVRTQSLKGVLVEDDDYKMIYWAMKSASEHSGHDMPAAKNLPLPDLEQMKADITRLDEYRDRIIKRAKGTEKRRKQVEKPPSAKVI